MTREEYELSLDQEMHVLGSWQLVNSGMTLESVEFLTSVGLPDGLLFFFDFTVKDSALQLRPSFAHTTDSSTIGQRPGFLEIGIDQGGNPVALEIGEQNPVVLLLHEREFQPKFINSSLSQLYDCAIAYKRAFDWIQEHPEAPASEFDRIRDELFGALQVIDELALVPSGYWPECVQYIVELTQ